MRDWRPCRLHGQAEMTTKPNGPLLERLLDVVSTEYQSGSPVAGHDYAHRQETASVAMRRWQSFSRRTKHPERVSHADRVEDLAKGLRDHFETEPALTGPLMADYRHLAARLADVLTNPRADLQRCGSLHASPFIAA
jgi:hypothetical protein